MSGSTLILIAVAGIFTLLFLVMRTKLHAFVSLLLVSLLVGVAAGMPLGDVIASVQNGMGGTLGFVAVVVGLGAMFGKMLEVSGGAERLAQTLVGKFGEDKAQWALAVANLIGAELGWVILFGVLAGIPATILAGPIFAKYIAKKIHVTIPDYMEFEEIDTSKELPSFKMIVSLISIPLVLILANTLSAVLLEEGNGIRTFFTFMGHPFVALTLATLLTFIFLGTRRGYTRDEVQEIATKALEPAGIIILVTGAGGVFKQVLIDSGVGDVLGEMMAGSPLPAIVLAFLIATVVRVAQGSATVSMVTAAGLITPLLELQNITGAALGLIVIAIASGATVLSHVNDSGFWLVNRYFGLDVKDTLKSWTVMETIIGLTGFAVVFLISLFII